ncbi:MAG: tryptophan-rich sensory protein [Fuerstiella sp.]|nr:tryptophan-rich sensory protein [Fuerstiella sp.]
MTAVATPRRDAPSFGQHLSLTFFIVLCFPVAATGRFFPPDDWYASLTRSSFAPPAHWVFGPVSTVLYLMMAVSGWMVWKSLGSTSKRPELLVFGVPLFLNAAWSAIFFGLHRSGWAFVEICFLWLAILITILLCRSHSKSAAVLLMPYLAWVSFATVLNYGLSTLN